MNFWQWNVIFGIALIILGCTYLYYKKTREYIPEQVNQDVTDLEGEFDFFHKSAEFIIYELKLWLTSVILVSLGIYLIFL